MMSEGIGGLTALVVICGMILIDRRLNDILRELRKLTTNIGKT